jgi:CRP/FNR family cyclic AMP-dependent transcriptional regulator
MDARAVIAANPFFAEVLGDPEIDRIARWAHAVEKAPGDDLIVEDDAGTSLFIIVSGEVEVLTGDGRRSKQIARLGPGDVVGEMSLMTGARRSATVTAATEVVALEITKFALEEILARAPDLIDSFGEVLSRRQAGLDRVAVDVARADKDDIVSQIRRFFGGK